MKYTFYYTDNNNARSRGYGQDKFFRKTFNLENDREALRKVLEIQNQANYDEFDEKFDEASLKELKDWAYDHDISGDPVVFYVENAHGKIIYDSELDIEDWMTDEDEIEDLDESRSRRLRGLRESEYTVRPKTKIELIKIIDRTIKEEGYDCDLNFIDTSLIKDMSGLFDGSKFNGDISKWDVSNVRNMESMFYGSVFNGDISKWDVSKVRNMEAMFFKSKFNGDISKWDVSNVENMDCMFARSRFNGDISGWDVTNVENMNSMFADSRFNGNISEWDVSHVRDMHSMFSLSPLKGNEPDWYQD